MRIHHLQDRIDKGLGAAARHIGDQYDAFRPATAANPLAAENRYLRLPATFTDENLTFRRPTGYGRAAWSGIFDRAYTKPGDYLSGPAGIFFIAAQQSLLPALCVLTNRTISTARPAAPTAPGINAYGGLLATTATPTRLTNYIASTLASGMGQYVGQVINANLFRRIRATQLSFMQNLLSQGILGSTDGTLPFSVICDTSNNPNSRTNLGYVQSDAQIQYQAINEKFIVNMEGGQTVQVNRQTLPAGQVGT